jgi:hypothetical protein
LKKYFVKRKYLTPVTDGLIMCVIFIFLQSFSHPSESEEPSMYANDYYSSGDTLMFSGYKWVTKESNERHTGPGRNYFAGGRENIWVDERDRMHIRMTHRNGHWYCAEARLVESLGYGTYKFRLEPNSAKLDKDLVVGFFTYDHDDTLNNHREIDIEFSRWGNEKDLNSQYVLQPFEVSENVHRYETDLTRKTEHEISWRKSKVAFKSSYIDPKNDSIQALPYASWTYKPHKKIKQHMEKFSMNIWLFKADFPGDFNDYEFIVSKFEFTPFKYEKYF